MGFPHGMGFFEDPAVRALGGVVMFSRKEPSRPPAEAKAPLPADVKNAAQSAPMKRPNRGSIPSIIGSDIVVNGTLTSTGHVQIDGRVKGDVRCAILVIGEPALIEGDITAEDVTIRGRLKGNVLAHKVHLASTCRVEGDIHRQSMSIESGAFFEGNSRHSDDPLSGGNASQRTASESIVKLAR